MTLILVAENDADIRQLLRDVLVHAGFEVIVSSDGSSALHTARTRRPDLLILDLGLPSMDGLDVARSLRRETEPPIIMLTARAEESDTLVGLELGADDYVTKPFSTKELVARVRAVLRQFRDATGTWTAAAGGCPGGRRGARGRDPRWRAHRPDRE